VGKKGRGGKVVPVMCGRDDDMVRSRTMRGEGARKSPRKHNVGYLEKRIHTDWWGLCSGWVCFRCIGGELIRAEKSSSGCSDSVNARM
jgi:hypothetical protein